MNDRARLRVRGSNLGTCAHKTGSQPSRCSCSMLVFTLSREPTLQLYKVVFQRVPGPIYIHFCSCSMISASIESEI